MQQGGFCVRASFRDELLGIPQGAVSRLERHTDMYVSTLRNYIRAMGGELKITVVFPNGVVEISRR
jgi:hypothetical protein